MFLDKREASQLDYLTVNETAVDPPTPGDDPSTNINAPDRLSLEATMINQNFSQQILKPGNRKVRGRGGEYRGFMRWSGVGGGSLHVGIKGPRTTGVES